MISLPLLNRGGEVILENVTIKKCCTCGTITNDLYSHHIVPKSVGGLDYEGNLVLVCGICHGMIHGKSDMSHLTAFEKRHGFSFIEYINIRDSCMSDKEICADLGISKQLLVSLKRLAGVFPPSTIKKYVEDMDYARWEYIPAGKRDY